MAKRSYVALLFDTATGTHLPGKALRDSISRRGHCSTSSIDVRMIRILPQLLCARLWPSFSTPIEMTNKSSTLPLWHTFMKTLAS